MSTGKRSGPARSGTTCCPESTIPKLGVNTSADTTNRLAVSSAATLLSHAGAGHQLKLNKNAAADTLSLLYQTNWSGRAEMGLAGSDDFELKVSADGSTWTTALKTSATGAVLMPGRPLVRATYGETNLTPASDTRTGFGTMNISQGGFSLGATVTSGVGSRLVVPVTGFYMISLTVSSVAAASYAVAVQQNGTTSLLTVRDSDSGSAATASRRPRWPISRQATGSHCITRGRQSSSSVGARRRSQWR